MKQRFFIKRGLRQVFQGGQIFTCSLDPIHLPLSIPSNLPSSCISSLVSCSLVLPSFPREVGQVGKLATWAYTRQVGHMGSWPATVYSPSCPYGKLDSCRVLAKLAIWVSSSAGQTGSWPYGLVLARLALWKLASGRVLAKLAIANFPERGSMPM